MSTIIEPLTDPQGATHQAPPRPAWLDERLYPFQSRYVEIEGQLLHYIDEGAGPTLFLLHPSVGWSFMYGGMIQELRGQFRCVALDLPGYGLSPAAPQLRQTLTGDSRLVERFIQTLGLTDVTLLAHDLTGSIALGVVARRPEWFRAVIILPSFAWPVESYPQIYRTIQVVGSPLMRALSVRFNFFLEYTLKTITKKPRQHFSAPEKQAYRGPNRDRNVRRIPHDLFHSAAKSHDYLADLEQRLRAIKSLPALLIFGDRDATIKMGWLARLEGIFPHHRSIIMHGSHHFPQIYDPSGVAAAIRQWWNDEIAA